MLPIIPFGKPAPYEIKNGIWMRANAASRFARLGAANASRCFSLSVWGKVGSGAHGAFATGYSNANNFTYFGLDAARRIAFQSKVASVIDVDYKTAAAIDDRNGHFNVVYQIDTRLAAPAERFKIWANGLLQTSFFTAINTQLQNAGQYWGDAFTQFIGCFDGASNHWSGVLSEIISTGELSSAPDASAFGRFDANGFWVPKRYVGAFGVNRFWLRFDDASAATAAAIGKDYSGGGNDFTPTNINVSGTTAAQTKDTPTSNHATLDLLADPGLNGGITDGSLTVATLTAAGNYRSNVAMRTGKYRGEFKLTLLAGVSPTAWVGVLDSSRVLPNELPAASAFAWGYGSTGSKSTNGSALAFGPTFATGDTIGVNYDADTGTVAFDKNGSPIGTAYTGISGPIVFYVADGEVNSTATFECNFGARPYLNASAGFGAVSSRRVPSLPVASSGSFVGNLNTDGPHVLCNGAPATLTINGNAVTWGVHAKKTAVGFKVVSAAAGYNASGLNSFVASGGTRFVAPNRSANNAQVN